jgi:glutamyl-Q tRNA(Asp) synthetase
LTAYTGRFAPSPTGPLHAGSLVAALASWLDARAHGGQWLVRMEDLDTQRCLYGMDRLILQQLADCGLLPDAPPIWQSQRIPLYQQALQQLQVLGLVYPCSCSRLVIEIALNRLGQPRSRHSERIYPGTCRPTGLQPIDTTDQPAATERAWRLRTDQSASNIPLGNCQWQDRRLGPQQQDVNTEVGDFVLQRADGCFTYQLAVVVDDAAQGISDVVRGEDLRDNTARQILLQQALGLATPRYLHSPLVWGANGEKLSKQNGATALDTRQPLSALNHAARVLGLPVQQDSNSEALAAWVRAWQQSGPSLYNLVP